MTRVALAGLLLGTSGNALAHGFGRLYNLPVPVEMYLSGAAAALILSFVVVGLFVRQRSLSLNLRTRDISATRLSRTLWHPLSQGLLRGLGLLALLATIGSGMWGIDNAYANLSMTLFWVIFALGYFYLTAFIGNSFALMNPWRTLADLLAAVLPRRQRPLLRWPARGGHWPAVILYMVFIWFELFGRTGPRALAEWVTGYTVLMLLGAALYGRSVWFARAEFFGLLFALAGRLAPLGRNSAGSGLELRQPGVRLVTTPAADLSVVVFILCLLSSTAFDGLKSSMPFVRLYWEHLAGWVSPWIGDRLSETLPVLKAIYPWWLVGWMILLPLLTLAAYLLCVVWAGRIARSPLDWRTLALAFAPTLIPIGFVYHLTHYYTLLLTQGTQVVRLLSNPMGWNWDLFGTASWQWRIIPEPGTIWHTQVWLIVVGHVISVYLAHLVALRLFADPRRAALSQLPMLALMVGLTSLGLWILALPLSPSGL